MRRTGCIFSPGCTIEIKYSELKPGLFSLQVWGSDKHQRGCYGITGRVLREAAGRKTPNNTALSIAQPDIFMNTNRPGKQIHFRWISWCNGMHGVGAAACSVHACGKCKVNSKAVGRYLPSFLLPPATLTVQSQDNGGETNSVLRQSNSQPLYCRCVSPRVGGKKVAFCVNVLIAAASIGCEELICLFRWKMRNSRETESSASIDTHASHSHCL